jgi:aspartate-semialdehyde dehydrogenase
MRSDAVNKTPVAVLGATGTVGQRFLTLLDDHPWFEVAALTASDRSAGKAYGDAVRWVQATPLPRRFAEMEVLPTKPGILSGDCPLVFSALDASVAGEAETAFAKKGHLVVSNAKSHRLDQDVPLVVPEVNAEHLELARSSPHAPGAIVANPNCSTIGLVLALKPLADEFGIKKVSVVTMQAISGAGLPGVASYEISDNVVPYIAGEEDKMQAETRKILDDDDLILSPQCNRVPVLDGHLQCVSVELDRKAEPSALRAAWEEFEGEPQRLDLPTAPRRPVHYLEGDASPQPRLHRELDKGMAASVGRLRPCPLFDYKFVTLSHNTLRGAAGGALLLAELAVAKGLLETS